MAVKDLYLTIKSTFCFATNESIKEKQPKISKDVIDYDEKKKEKTKIITRKFPNSKIDQPVLCG